MNTITKLLNQCNRFVPLRVILAGSCFLLTTTVFAQIQIGQDINGEADGDASGVSVSMPNATTIAIGATGNDGGDSLAGHVRVYEWSNNNWEQKGNDINGEYREELSGYSVSMPDDNTVAVGAPYNDENGLESGQVRVYEWNGNDWVQKGKDLSGEENHHRFGFSVSMPNANTLAIGAPSEQYFQDPGKVYIYEWDGSNWIQRGSKLELNIVGGGTQTGYSVSMPDANTIAFSTNYYGFYEEGQVNIFEWDGSDWSEKGSDINGENDYDRLGTSVSMPDPNTIAIGAENNDGNTGYVRVYHWKGSTWEQKGEEINGEERQSYSGNAVSMPDSNTVAIGAKWNDGNTGRHSGHVRVYKWHDTAWVQIGIDIEGEAEDNYAGRSVSMPNAKTVAIGASGNDENGDFSGHVRVFSLDTVTSANAAKSLNDNISVYYAQDQIRIDLTQSDVFWSKAEILSISGQIMKSQQLEPNKQQHNLSSSNLAAGLYLIHLSDREGRRHTERVIIP